MPATRPIFPFVSMVRLWLVLLGLLLSGCVIPLPMRGLRGADPAPVLAPKLVVAKHPPADLIADDGTHCLVTRRRFERTRIGSEAWCVWTGDGGLLRR
jgi:hypothetical protein